MKKEYCLSLSMLRIYLEFTLLLFLIPQLKGQIYSDPHLLVRQVELKRENRFDEAITLLESKFDSLKTNPDLKPAIENRLMKADLYRMKGQYNLSELLLDSLLGSYFTNPAADDVLTAYYWTIQGTLLLTKRELEKGRGAVLRAIEIYSKHFGIGDSLLAPCYNKLGNYYYYKKNCDSALACYNKALELTDNKFCNLEDSASYLQNIGIIHLEHSDYNQAETCFLESLRLKEMIYSPNSYSLGRIYLNLGRFYQEISNLEKSLLYLEKAESIFSKDGLQIHIELGSIFWNKGIISLILGDNELAFTYFFNAKQIIESSVKDSRSLLSPLFMDIGLAYDKNNEKDKAIIFYNSSLIGADDALKAKINRNIANLYLHAGDLIKAGEYFNKLPVVRAASEDSNPENALTYLYYGEYLKDKGGSRALEYLERSYEIFSKNFGLHNRDVAASLQTIGDYYFKKDQLDSALAYYQKALITASKSFTDSNVLANPPKESLNIDWLLMHILSLKAICLNKYYCQNGIVTYLISSVETYLLCMDLID
jgi:tetratricopeptide (TPR) repeat protein